MHLTKILILLVAFNPHAICQVPGSAFEESDITGNVQQATKIVMPDSPNVGTNNQSLNFSPTISPGNTSLAAPTGNSVGAGSAQPGTGGAGEKTEGIVAEKLKNLEIDPANETVINSKTGSIWAITDNWMVDARYERYLNQDAYTRQKQEKYLHQLNEILQLLCPKNPYGKSVEASGPTREEYGKAYQLLRNLSAEFSDYDGGVANTLANQVDALNAALAARQKLYAEVNALEKEIQRAKWNMDVTVKHRMERSSERRGANAPAENAERAMYAAQAGSGYAREIAKYQALQAAKTAQAEAKMLLAKTEFQTLLVQHFAARRFQQVLIGGAFYRSGFGDGEMSITTDTKLTQLLSEKLGVPLTVTVLEAATVEAIEDVRRGMGAVSNMLADRKIAGAEKRLMETLLIGENLPEMLAFSVEQRKAILAFRQMRQEATKAVEVKDFGRAEEKNNLLSKMASDYDPAMVRAAVTAGKSESNMHLLKARNAATSGDQATAEAEVKLAATAWPQNPTLENGTSQMMDKFNAQAGNLKELDTLLEKGDLRGIEAKREAFTASVADDPERQVRLRAALESLVEIEKAIERAREYEQNGSPAEAWAAVEATGKKYPNDQKLLRITSDYAARSPDFVRHISSARDAAAKKDIARALISYLSALRDNPSSEEARLKTTELAEKQLSLVEQP